MQHRWRTGNTADSKPTSGADPGAVGSGSARKIGEFSVLLGVDAILLRVPDLDVGLAFYREGLGHDLIWRTESMVGLRMWTSGTELVLATDRGPEADLLVQSVDDAVRSFIDRGGSLIAGPRDLPVGRLAVVRDPSATSWFS